MSGKERVMEACECGGSEEESAIRKKRGAEGGGQRYDDIIGLPRHVSQIRPQMPRSVRAAQFAPFAALAGFEEAVREAEEAFVRSQSQA